ncbi:MAG: Xaa-Pro peptidase family protein [Candidatus Norongarragalinales archaeon]
MFEKRLSRLQRKLRALRIDLLVLGARERSDANVFYYAGDDSYPALFFVTPSEAKLLSTASEPLNSSVEFEALIDGGKQFAAALKQFKPRSVAVDAASDYAALLLFRFLKQGIKPKNFAKELGELRLFKDASEQRAIREAQRLTKHCVSKVLERGVYGKTEHQVAGLLEAKARELGAALAAFPPIIVSGERTAIPHAEPSNKLIRKGDVVLIDVGCKQRGYCSDYSTTIYDGGDERKTDALEAVKEARTEALKKAKPGVKGSALAQIALHVLADYGLEKTSFKKAGLSVGHFVGLEVHEGPKLERTTLQRGMVFALEPGVYEKKSFGCRFEDVAFL